MKHFGLGPNGAIMILGLPVSFFFFFFEPTQVEDGASRLVLCGLCGLNSTLIHQRTWVCDEILNSQWQPERPECVAFNYLWWFLWNGDVVICCAMVYPCKMMVGRQSFQILCFFGCRATFG